MEDPPYIKYQKTANFSHNPVSIFSEAKKIHPFFLKGFNPNRPDIRVGLACCCSLLREAEAWLSKAGFYDDNFHKSCA